MKTTSSHFAWFIAVVATISALATSVATASPAVTAQLDRTDIALGDSAQLTITASGSSADNISPPAVPGLEFDAVGQSSQIDSINGATTSTTSITYAVIPQRAGRFTIPALSRGSKSLVLYVQPGNGCGANPGNRFGAPSPPPPATGGLSAGATHLSADGAAFVRLRLTKHELYVGESVPVEIQVGLRPGLAAQLDGLPTLNGDAFTLNRLSDKPEQTQEIIGDTPYSVLTWHSVLGAVKPGDFPLAIETPLTVQMRAAPPRLPQMPGGIFDDPMFSDLFNDPFFQNFFGGITEKQITVAGEPETFKVLELPAAGQPAGFGGAVGQFSVSSEISADQCTAGDPLTLRLKIAGTGNFDRVNSPMLGAVNGWKTYQPSAQFTPADSAGYTGEKDFEQAVIPMLPGRQTVPALTFSFFNPETRRYETEMTAPLSVEVSPAGSLASTAASAASANPAGEAPRNGLRPDHVETGGAVVTLCPLYFQPWFVGTQGALILGFAGGLVFLRRRQQRAQDAAAARRRETSGTVAVCLNEMETAASTEDAARFFQSARAALQQQLATRWHVAPASITIAEIDERLNDEGVEIRRLFELADQAAYSGQHLTTADFQQWEEVVLAQIKPMEEL